MSKYNIVSNDPRYIKIIEQADKIQPTPIGYEEQNILDDLITTSKEKLENIGRILVIKTKGKIEFEIIGKNAIVCVDGEELGKLSIEDENEHLVGFIGDYELIKTKGEVIDIISWHLYDSPRIALDKCNADIILPSTIAYVDFNEFLGKNFNGSIQFEYLDEYEISRNVDIKVGDYLVGTTKQEIKLDGTLPNHLYGDFEIVEITSDEIPEKFAEGHIKNLVIRTDVDESAFENAIIDNIYIEAPIEIGQFAFKQPYKREVNIYSPFDLTDFNWEENNIIPIYKEQ